MIALSVSTLHLVHPLFHKTGLEGKRREIVTLDTYRLHSLFVPTILPSQEKAGTVKFDVYLQFDSYVISIFVF